MPKNQRKKDILQPQPPNYVSFLQPANYDSVTQPTNLASVIQPTNYDQVPQPTNHASIPQTTIYDSVPQTTNYASITQTTNYASTTLPNNYPQVTPPNNYRPVTPPNNYPQVNLPKDYATVTQITKHTSIPQNSKPLIIDLMPPQEKKENVLIPPSDYQLAFSNEQQKNITEQHMPNNSQMIYKEGHISQPYNEANNYGKIPEHQVQESNYDPLFQIQGQPNDGNENAFILNEKGSNEEKGYSYNKLNNKIISTSNRLDEKILQQENLNEWFRKVVLELQNSNKEMGKEMNKTFNKIEETFNELGKLHKEQKFLNEKIFQWMRGRHTYSEYPIYHHSENPIYQYSGSPINQYAENPIYI